MLLLGEFPRLNQLCSSHTLELLMGARGHLKDLTQHLALLLTLDLNLKIDTQRILEECKNRTTQRCYEDTNLHYLLFCILLYRLLLRCGLLYLLLLWLDLHLNLHVKSLGQTVVF